MLFLFFFNIKFNVTVGLNSINTVHQNLKAVYINFYEKIFLILFKSLDRHRERVLKGLNR